MLEKSYSKAHFSHVLADIYSKITAAEKDSDYLKLIELFFKGADLAEKLNVETDLAPKKRFIYNEE